MNKVWRTLNFQIKDIDEEARTFTAIASDDSTDRHGENIEQSGWDLENFIKNPVVPWSHDYYAPPVAKANEIGLKDGKLMFVPQFAKADEYPFADTIFKLYKGGYLRAFSVGFIPTEMDGDTFKKQELLEISAVTVPSNPNALALAYKEGVIDETERKSLINGMEIQIKNLTTLGKLKENINMEEVKQLLADAVKELKEANSAEIAELKSEIEKTVETKLADLDQKFVAKDIEEVTDADDKEKADPATGGEKPPKTDEEADADADDDSKELTDDEAKALLPELVKDAANKLSGKVE
jgi:hypothetical protein